MVELLGLVECLFRVGHGLHHMTTVREAGLQVMAQQRFIFYDQQFHNALPGTHQHLPRHDSAPRWLTQRRRIHLFRLIRRKPFATCRLKSVVRRQIRLGTAGQIHRALLAAATAQFGAGITT